MNHEARHQLVDTRLRPCQKNALNAIFAKKRGIVVMPCGSGKTLVALGAICDSNAFKTLVLTSSSEAAYQIKRTIARYTDICEDNVHVITSDSKECIKGAETVVVTTYTLFGRQKRSEENEYWYNEIQTTKFDCVVLDETHMVPAATIKRFVTSILESESITTVIGLTATLYRERSSAPLSKRRQGEGADFADELDFIGPVIFRYQWSVAQKEGIIAKYQFCRVVCTFDDDFRTVHDATEDINRRSDISCLTASKLQTAANLAKMHNKAGQRCIVFVDKILLLSLLQEKTKIFKQYKKVQGENSKGKAQVFEQLERGEIPGILSTCVGDTAHDFQSKDVCVIIIVNTNGASRRQHGQRIGRASRTPDPSQNGDAEEVATEARKNVQKRAFVWDLVTDCKKDIEEADNRDSVMLDEGYEYRDDTRNDQDTDLVVTMSTDTEVTTMAVDQARIRPLVLSDSERADLLTKLSGRQQTNAVERAVSSEVAAVRAQHYQIFKSRQQCIDSKADGTPMQREIKRRLQSQLDRDKKKTKNQMPQKIQTIRGTVAAQMESAAGSSSSSSSIPSNIL